MSKRHSQVATLVALPKRARSIVMDPGDPLPYERFDGGVFSEMRELLAPANGISANGLTLPAQVPNSTAFDLGLDDFTIYIKSMLGSWTPDSTVVLWDKVAANLGPRLSVLSTGFLRFQLGNGSDMTTYQFDSTAKISDAVGAVRAAHIVAAVDRVNGSLAFSVNGVLLGAAVNISAAAAQTATSTAPIRLHSNGSTHHSGVLLGGFAPLYNTCLSASLVLDTYLRGGVPPVGYLLIATSIASYSDDFVAGIAAWSASGAVSIAHDAGNSELDFSNFAAGTQINHDEFTGFYRPHQRYRVKYELRNIAAPSGTYNVRTNVTQTVAVPTRTLQNEVVCVEFTGSAAMFSSDPKLGFNRVSGGGVSGSIKSWSLTRVGAICYYGMTEGAGLQLIDGTANRRHALLGSTEVFWLTSTASTVRLRAATDGTTTAQQLGGGTIIPANSRILRLWARAQSGTPSITVGTSSGGTQVVASVALSTTWQPLTVALVNGLVATAAALWVTASAANTVEFDGAYELLSP